MIFPGKLIFSFLAAICVIMQGDYCNAQLAAPKLKKHSGRLLRHFSANVRFVTVKPDLKSDLICGSSLYPQLWCPGGSGPGLWVGDANIFNHRYRALLRFDIRPFLIAGKVKKAVLEFSLRNLYGEPSARTFKLQCFTDEKVIFKFNDLMDTRVETVKEFTVERKMKYPRMLVFDVCSELNSALYKGYGSCSFRILDEWAEQHGHPRGNTAAGTAIIPASVKLEIAE